MGPSINYTQRRKSVYNFGGVDIVKNGESECAEGAKQRLPKEKSHSRLARRKLPSGVWDGALETNAILTFSVKIEYILGYVNLIFSPIKSKKVDQRSFC